MKYLIILLFSVCLGSCQSYKRDTHPDYIPEDYKYAWLYGYGDTIRVDSCFRGANGVGDKHYDLSGEIIYYRDTCKCWLLDNGWSFCVSPIPN